MYNVQKNLNNYEKAKKRVEGGRRHSNKSCFQFQGQISRSISKFEMKTKLGQQAYGSTVRGELSFESSCYGKIQINFLSSSKRLYNNILCQKISLTPNLNIIENVCGDLVLLNVGDNNSDELK